MAIPSFAKAVSNCLSHVLENVGVNEETVAKRRELYHQSEVIKEIGHNLMAKYCNIPSFKNYKICHFGSRIEGSTTFGMNSDIDLVYLCPFLYSIVQSNVRNTQGLCKVMIEKSAPSGYCKLKAYAVPEPYFVDHRGDRFIPNAHIDEYFQCTMDMSGISPMIKNGPSSSAGNTDHIKAILVPSNLLMSSEIIKRFHSYSWPSQNNTYDKVKE
ncbi:uncharacterized protein LOC132742241 [Ruditapes philippinarum]|uniref:uncharacterized protein LOC132742241 n=1 Tax=Ruditapes philippinarum TaxID=129788 RepID=UPI00295B0BF6|nr:uncharacterized protein LOC132742241 [Ruditapes philippinarum]